MTKAEEQQKVMAKQRAATLKKNEKKLEIMQDQDDDTPRSFVFSLNPLSRWGEKLMAEMRQVFEPHTATKLKVTRKNKLQDLKQVAGEFKITHFIMFNQIDKGVNIRFTRFPHGPTAFFNVNKYMLKADLGKVLKNTMTLDTMYASPCVLILNNFQKKVPIGAATSNNKRGKSSTPSSSGSSKNSITNADGSVTEEKVEPLDPHYHIEIIQSMFQNMFPSLDIQSVKISSLRRALLINYNDESDTYEFRHYKVLTRPTNINRSIKKVITSHKKIFDLSKLDDISELITNPAAMAFSESEFTDQEAVVELPSLLPKGMRMAESVQSAIRLHEIGPRLDLALTKITHGFDGGEVIYHKYISKTPQEKLATKRRVESRNTLKAKRKLEQDENIAKKKIAKEDHRQKSIQGIKNKYNLSHNSDKESSQEELDYDHDYNSDADNDDDQSE